MKQCDLRDSPVKRRKQSNRVDDILNGGKRVAPVQSDPYTAVLHGRSGGEKGKGRSNKSDGQHREVEKIKVGIWGIWGIE